MIFLAKRLLEALSQNISDSSYLADKQADFEQLDTLAAARKIASLDAKNQSTLAALLGVEPVELATFSRVLAKL
jgi:hypothetical protein